MNKSFSSKWINETRGLAIKCVNRRFIELINKGESKSLTNDEEQELHELNNSIKDAQCMWFISEMIFRVEHDLYGRFEIKSKMATHEIYNVISKESYWENVFNNKLDTEEAININNLKNSLSELIKL